MTHPEALKHQQAAFMEGDTIKVGPHTVRNFSIGTLNICRDMGLSLFTEEKTDPATVTTQEKQRQTMAFAWASAAPLSVVLDAVEDGTWPRKVKEFEFTLDISALPEFMMAMNKLAVRAAASAVKVVPRSGTSGEEQAPGN